MNRQEVKEEGRGTEKDVERIWRTRGIDEGKGGGGAWRIQS